jgi:DNA polymerase I-like protein with 3'-5' exonuclease and polymerase domains
MPLDWLWSAVEEQRVHDTMLLPGLVSLAESDDDRLPSLDDAVQQYCRYQLEKDTYQTRYAETIHQDWTKLDPGFFEYAVSDAIGTYQLHVQLTREAKHIVEQAGASRQYGFLTEAIQVKAAICLDNIHRRGVNIDLDRAAELRQDVDKAIQSTIQSLQEQAGPDVFHRYKKTGKRKLNKATSRLKQ